MLRRGISATTKLELRQPTIKPSPLPLSNPLDQQNFEQLVQQNNAKVQDDVLLKVQHPDFKKEYKEFEGNVNPDTGEVGGPKGKEPTRYGDWERNGRVYDF
jgi:hypothetical protein